MNPIVSPDSPISPHQGHEAVLALEKAGFGPQELQRVIENPVLAASMLALVKNSPEHLKGNQNHAAYWNLLGNNFFSPHEVAGLFGSLDGNEDKLETISGQNEPQLKELLQRNGKDYSAFPMPWVTWRTLKSRFPRFIPRLEGLPKEIAELAYTGHTSPWRLLKNAPRRKSCGKSYERQNTTSHLEILPEGVQGLYYTPSVFEVAVLALLHDELRGKTILKNVTVRCKEPCGDGYHAAATVTDGRLIVDKLDDDTAHSELGIAFALNFS